ncbi:Os03g0652000, partial [Oryza sativa Japonica Group]
MVEEGARRRVVVEVCNARNLMPKDGQGTASAYAVVDFDGQRRRTATRPRDLNPQWGERLEFLVHDPDAMCAETLELNLYNDKKAIAATGGGGRRGGTFLGKVKVAGASFSKAGDEVLVYYPLEKRSVFSQIKGEIGLKIWFVDEPPPPPPPAAPADGKADAAAEKKEAAEGGKEEKEKAPAAAAASAAEEKKPEAPAEEKKAEEAKKEEKKSAEADKKEEKDDKKKSPEKGKKDGEKPKEEGKAKDETKKEVAPVPPSPSKAPPPSPSKMELAAAGVAGDLEIRPQSAAERSMAASAGNASYDLVDRVPYLFVRLLKAKHHGGGDKQPLYAQLSIGTHAVKTRAATAAGEWDQVFAFHKDSLTATSLEVTVHEEAKKPAAEGEATPPDTNLGYVSFDLHEVPKRSPPDSALAPQWYTLEGHA